ncbi:hypothetical protein V2J09_002497 [Rumex salicifolius]
MHHAGCFTTSSSQETARKSDPVLIWLEGGPGCSSATALFYENGPFHFINNVSNIIYVDQPTGTGFSYTTNDDDFRHDEQGISNDLYDFMQDHPEYVNNDVYIAGEEYAGHFIPAFASRIQQGNKAKQGIHINLKEKGLINDSDYKHITKMILACQNAVQLCAKKDDCSAADACIEIFRQTSSSIPDKSLNLRRSLPYLTTASSCSYMLANMISSTTGSVAITCIFSYTL